MEKCEIRKKILEYERNLKKLREVKVEGAKEKIRQVKDAEIIKDKIKNLKRQLEE